MKLIVTGNEIKRALICLALIWLGLMAGAFWYARAGAQAAPAVFRVGRWTA